MGRISYGWVALRENRRSGLALLIALCASALLLSLTLGLIYAASIPVARANRKLQQERCHVLVGSFAAVVDTELRKYTAEAVGLDWEEPVWDDTANSVAAEGSFYSQVNAVLEDCDRTGCGFEAPISLKLDDGNPDEPYGDLEIRLHLTDLTDTAVGTRRSFREDITAVHDTAFHSYGSFGYGEAAEGARTAELENKFIRYRVRVDEVATVGGEAMLRSAGYYREDCYQPFYTWHVTNLDSRPDNFEFYRPVEGTQASPLDGVQVFWDPVRRKFFQDGEKTVEIEPAVWVWDAPSDDADSEIDGGNRHTWEEEVTVSYVYYNENGEFDATYKHFVPVYEKDRADGVKEDGGDVW